MRSGAIALAVLALAPLAHGQTPVEVRFRQTAALPGAGASAAWAVDPTVAEVAIRNGEVTVAGRAAGTTAVSVVSGGEVRTYRVTVTAPPVVRAVAASAGPRQSTAIEGGYDSATGRSTAGVDLSDTSAGRSRRLHVTAVRQEHGPDRSRPAVSLPSVSIEVASRGSEVVLFDRLVEHSPLTVDGVTVRGLHVRRGPLRLHAGYASSLLYDGLVVPAGAEGVAGAGWDLAGGGWTLTPSVFSYRTDAGRGGTRGTVGSLAVGRGRESDPFRLRAEAGYGGRWGGAAELSVAGGGSALRMQARHRPLGFASLALGKPAGTFADSSWTAAAGPLSLSASGSFGRYALPRSTQRSDAATGSVRLALSGGWSVTGAASAGWFDLSSGAVRSLSLPATLAYEGRHAGVSALYRHQRNTATNRGGSGGRVGLRASGAGLRFSVFVDGQRDAATVDFVLREEPRIARLLAEQGLAARTPDEIARFLDESAGLSGLGYLDGVRIDVNPWRLQAGGDLVWSLGRQQLRARGLFDRTRAVAGERETRLVSVSYTHRLAGAELVGGYTWSRSDLGAWADQGSSFQVALRTRFEGLPRAPWGGGDAVSGVVFVDELATGAFAKGLPPLAGVRVRLDGTRVATTDAHGRFRLEDVGPGTHSLEALLPADEGAFFTTPSTLPVAAGGAAAFGISRTPARLSGFVRDDAGRGIANVALRLEGGGRAVRTSTDSSGRYAFATAEGSYAAGIDAESLPAGYDAAAATARTVALARAAAARLDLVVPAQRSVSGRVRQAGAQRAVVRLVEAGRSVEAGRDGAYVFRGLKPGRYTLATTLAGVSIRREVVVPDGPAVVTDADLGAGTASAAPARRR
ncbi:MAG: hypothetical protein ABW221_03345 [Vicinamibacteria bacterium]